MAAYTNSYHIRNGLQLDFTTEGADTTNDGILGVSATGQVTKFTSIPRSRVSGGGDLTEATSSVLTITGGTGAVLTSGLTIQVKLAATGQSGYLSSTDWNTFNNKLSPTLTSAYVFVGNGSNVATGVAVSGDITISNAGVVAIAAGVIVNADVHASAAIAVSKLAALTASRAAVLDGSGFLAAATTTATQIGYLSNTTSDIQAQFTTTNQRIVGLTTTSTVQGPGAGQNGYAIIWDNANSRWDLGPVGSGGSVTGPGSSTDTALVRWSGTGGTSILNSTVLLDGSGNLTGVTSIAVNTAGLKLADTDSSHYLVFVAGSDLTANRNLTLTTGDAARTITLSGNPTLSDWFDQSVKTSAAVVFADVTVSNAGGLHILDSDESHDLIITTSSDLTADRTLTLVPGDAARTLTINASGTIYVTGGTDVALADGGTGASLADPGADRVMFWDDSAGFVTWLTMGTNLSISGTTLNASGGGGGISDGTYGDIVVSSSGAVWTVTPGYWKVTGTTPLTGNTIIGGSGSNYDLTFGTLGDGEIGTLTALTVNGTAISSSAANTGALLVGTTGDYFRNSVRAFELSPTSIIMTSGTGPSLQFTSAGIATLNLGSDAIGDLYQRNASGNFTRLASVSAGSFLRSGGVATVSAWSTLKIPDTIAANSIFVANSADTLVAITPAAGESIRRNAGGTAWEAYTPIATGTAWLLASGGTLTAANTLTANTTGWLTFTGTWTAAANNDFHTNFAGSFTARATASDVLLGYKYTSTLVAAAATQTLLAVELNPTFTPGAHSPNQVTLRAQNGAVVIGAETSYSVNGVSSVAAAGQLFIRGSSNPSINLSTSGQRWSIVGGVSTNDIIFRHSTQISLATFLISAMTGGSSFTQGALASVTSPKILTLTGGAHTTLTASTEAIDVDFNFARTVQFATGALTTQRSSLIRASTYGFVGASTLTKASTLSITGAPVAGTNATITTSIGFEVEAGAVGSGTGTSFGIKANAQTGATTNYSAYFSGGSGILLNGFRLWTDHDLNGKDNFLIGLTTPTLSGITGIDNFTVLGLQALTSGDNNIAIGNTAGQAITQGGNNILLGYLAGGSIVTGNSNILFGNQTGSILTGSNNIFIGTQVGAGAYTSGSGSVAIGVDINPQSNTADNQLTIQNAIFGAGNAGSDTTMSSGVIGLYSTAAQGSWQKATFIGNIGVESTAIANGIVLYSKDSSDGSANATLALYTEQAPEASVVFVQSHRMKVWWNGVEFWVPLDAV